MKRVYLTLCLFIMMVFSIGCITAFASDWYYVGTSDDGNVSAYIDNASVAKNNREATVWVKWTRSDGSQMITQIYYTRHPKTSTWLYLAEYDTQGNVVDSETISYYEQEARPIVPDSMDEGIWYCIWPY